MERQSHSPPCNVPAIEAASLGNVEQMASKAAAVITMLTMRMG